MKNLNYLIGNQTPDLAACSAGPHPSISIRSTVIFVRVTGMRRPSNWIKPNSSCPVSAEMYCLCGRNRKYHCCANKTCSWTFYLLNRMVWEEYWWRNLS